jgi:hypothetical protein
MRWRHLRSDELDHERIWLFVTLGTAFLGWLWLHSGVPTPKCTWHEMTGWPCPGCGSTRSVRHLLDGDWSGAMAMNPLFFLTLVLIVLYDLYAAIVLVFRLPRLRLEHLPEWVGWTVRLGFAAVFIGNWAWLIARKV